MECRLPELVVVLQESNHQVFKDKCMEGKECSLENCELNHHNIYYMLKYEQDNSAELENTVSESYQGNVKQVDDPKKLLMEGKADTEIADATSFSHDVSKRASLDKELVDQKENQDQKMKPGSMASKFVSKEACCDKGRIADSISREGSVPNIKAENSTSTEDGKTRSLASLFADQYTEKHQDREDMNLVVSSTKQCHDNISIRSSSTNSTKSFAFPILTSEWAGSPVKMVEADKRDSKRKNMPSSSFFHVKVQGPPTQIEALSFAEEAAKRSQEFTIEAAKRTQELSIGSSKLSDVVSEASKQIVAEASKRADQIKFQIPSSGALSSLVDSSSTSQTASAHLEKFGVTHDLREFVKGITNNTFHNFQLQDELEISDIPTVSNIRQDLTEFQEKHAKLVLSSVKEISKLRYEICPRIMRERKFWKIYFILVNSHLAPYEKKFMDEISAEKANVEEAKDISSAGTTSKPVIEATTQTNKKAASSTADQDLDLFLLGEDSDEGPDDEENAFDDDFDKI